MQLSDSRRSRDRPENLSERIYSQLKDDIFEFRLLPGDRFSEGDIAARMQASRTPVRLALYRLEREGYLEVYFRSGWQVKPFDFRYFEELYDLRIVLEQASVRRLCALADPHAALEALSRIWLVPPAERLTEQREVSALDEAFHCGLVEAAGNTEMARVHRDVSEKIRIIRRLDFTQPARLEATYDEHARILTALMHHRAEEAQQLLRAHIEISKAEVRKITLHRLHCARDRDEPRQAP